MKTTILTRIYALALSTVFATLATIGVAVIMTESGDRAQMAASNAAVTSTLSQVRANSLGQL